KLPDTERAQWQKLWADVDNLRKQVPLQPNPSKPFDHKFHLARLYFRQGNYNKAEILFQVVLQASEASDAAWKRGADNLFTLQCKYALAQHYFFQGKYALAETLYQDVLQRETAQLGPDHRDVLDTKSGLARVYTAQGRYDRAEPILEKVVAQTA